MMRKEGDQVAVTPASPASDQAQVVIGRHLLLTRGSSPPEHVHSLDTAGLSGAVDAFFLAYIDAEPIGMVALRRLDERRVELKSMHVLEEARGRGAGRELFEQAAATAREWGCAELVLETGTADAFAAARRLYEAFGFVRYTPFGEYTDNEFSMCMRFELQRT